MNIFNRYTINIILCLLTLATSRVCGQQRMQYTTQVLQGYMQNPALAGIENFHDIRLIYNKQWTGFDGAPTAKGIGFSTQVGDDTNSTTVSKTLPLIGRLNPANQNNTNKKTVSNKVKIGYGGTLISEGNGTININEFVLMGAAHFSLKKGKLSTGIGLGLTQHQFNPNNIKLINSYDLTFSKQELNIILPTIQLGAMYYTNEFFIGFGTKQLVKTQFSYDLLNPDKRSELVAHSNLTAGLRLKAGSDYTFTPSLILRRVRNAPSTADINVISDFKDFVRLGFMYRTNGDLAGILGIIVNHKYSVQYAYDISNSRLRKLYSNTHNLVLSIRLSKKEFANTVPVNYW
jgi:type IX secretion system PorP/SprF family membrane protein